MPATVDCAPYLCGTGINANACAASCQGSRDCVPGAFCDTAHGGACCALSSGGAVSVDSLAGSDVGCCGVGKNGPCQTLTRAMALIDMARASNVTINATVDGGGGDWTAAGEVYPVAFGWGVELSAPGVFFLDADGGHDMMFDVKVYGGDPLGYASLIGSPASPIGVGINSAQSYASLDAVAIAIESGATLYLANASVNVRDRGDNSSSAILVNAGATLWLGQDRLALNAGTVFVGNNKGTPATSGYIGINCLTDGVNSGGTVKDAPLIGQSSVVIQGENIDLWLNDYSVASLTASPMLGAADCLGGMFSAAAGAVVDGHSRLTLSNGIVQCMGFAGLGTSTNTPGDPTITLDHMIIEDTFQGVVSNAGKITVTNSTLRGNWMGAVQMAGTLDLSGGGNTVVCSSNRLFGGSSVYGPGIDVYNPSTTNLAADNVAWDRPGPDYYRCDSNLSNCVCKNATCSLTPGTDGMDAVEDSTNLGGITFSGHAYLDAGCN
jgi:hypothetical protein